MTSVVVLSIFLQFLSGTVNFPREGFRGKRNALNHPEVVKNRKQN